MKLLLSTALAVFVASSVAAERPWQTGILREVEQSTVNAGSITVPIGGYGTTPPTLYTFPSTVPMEFVSIDAPDGIRYVAYWHRRFLDLVINDPIAFAIDGETLYVKGPKGKENKLKILKRIRVQPQ